MAILGVFAALMVLTIISTIFNMLFPPETNNVTQKHSSNKIKPTIDYDLVHTLNYYETRKPKTPPDA